MRAKLLASAMAVGLVTVAAVADASQINIGPAAFVASGANSGFLSYNTSSVSSTKTSTIGVSASIPHNTSSSGFTVYVDGHNYTATAVNCTLWIADYNGNFLASILQTTSAATGDWELTFPVTAAQSPQWAYFNLACGLLASGNSELYGAIVL